MSGTLPRVYLVRHGATEWTRTGQHTGRTDLPLTTEGMSEARALGPSLVHFHAERVLTSPLLRARRTAELAMSDATPEARIETDDDLMEWDYGAYEGKRTAEIVAERPGWRLFRDGCPGGETVAAVGARADRVIGRLRANGGNVLLFGHRDILRILAARWIGLEPAGGGLFQLATASVSVLGYDHNLMEPVIHRWNGKALE